MSSRRGWCRFERRRGCAAVASAPYLASSGADDAEPPSTQAVHIEEKAAEAHRR